MSTDITILVLCAALFHAIWNALIKGGKDPLLGSMLVCLTWIVVCVPLVFFLPLPSPESWPFAVGSIVIHTCYFLLLSKTYKIGDFGSVYPIVRGLPPLIVTMVGAFFIDEPLSLYGVLGVILIGTGILSLEIGNKFRSYKPLAFAFATALMIASYTVVDGLGARVSGHSMSFLAWFSLIQSIIFVGIVFFLRTRQQCLMHVRQKWKYGFLGGLLSFFAYAIVLWAITKAPIPYVSAMRETSVLFASIIAILFLGEPFRKNRLVSAVLIFCGICVIKWA